MNIEALFTKKKSLDSNKIKKFKQTEEFIKIKEKYSNFICSDNEILYLEYNSLLHPPKCIICDKQAQFKLFIHGYNDTCGSKKCSAINPNRINKIRNTKISRYGDSGFNNKQKRIKTNLEKYGVEQFWQSNDFKKKNQETIISRYGITNISQLDSVKKKKIGRCGNGQKTSETRKRQKLEHDKKKYLLDEKWLSNTYKQKTIVGMAEDLGVSPSSINNAMIELNIPRDNWNTVSYIETNLANEISQLGINIRTSARNIIKPYELDIYIPDYNLAIEVDGVFWHSISNKENDTPTARNYHLKKTQLCEEKGIQLLRFTDKEIKFKNDIVISMIKSKLGINEIIYARKCKIIDLEPSEGHEFIENNHIQGGIKRGFYKALEYNGIIVAVIQCGAARYNKNYDYEILRFASKTHMNVVGAFTKLLKSMNISGTIVSYANRRWSNGSVYQKNGFELKSVSPPNYWYFGGDTEEMHSRLKFQKHKLDNILSIFDKNLTESENMFNNGYRKFYDCGNLVYTKNI